MFFSITLAGTPATILPSISTSLITTALAPIMVFEATLIGPRILAPAPIVTLSPNLGPFYLLNFVCQ